MDWKRLLLAGSGTIVRSTLREDASRYLDQGEQIQAVFAAKRPAIQYNDRAVVATERRLLLIRLDRFGRGKEVVGEVPRGTPLGPCRGWMYPIDAFGTRMAVNRRFFKDVSEADRAAGFNPPQ